MIPRKHSWQGRALAWMLAFALVVTGCFGQMGPLAAQAASTLVAEKPVVAVSGQAVVTGGGYSAANAGLEKSYTLNDLKTIAAADPGRYANDLYSYSTRNTFDTKRLYLGEGVRMDTLLALSGVTGNALSDHVISAIESGVASPYVVSFDPARTTYGTENDKNNARTTQAFSQTRYYYPGNLQTPPSETGASEVPTILAWGSRYSTAAQPTGVDSRTSLMLMTGQLGITDYNNPLYNSAVNLVQAGSPVTETVLSIGSAQYTRTQLLLMDRASAYYTYSTSSGSATDFARGVPLSVLLAGWNDNDVVTFNTADGYPVAASGKTKKQLVDNDYMLAYEKGADPGSLAGIYSTAKNNPSIYGLLTLYGSDAEGKPSKMVTSITVTPATGPDFENSPYKHINNGGITNQSGPYDIDAITGATLTVEGPGVVTSIPLSVRTVESQNQGAFRGLYTDQILGTPNTKTYEGIKLSYILTGMPSGSEVTLTDAADRVVIKNRARQTIATFTMAQIEEADEAGKPIIVSYGVGSEDGSIVAPFVYDGQAGSIPGLYNEDGCLKLVYDKSSITGDVNTTYQTFGNMAYIYVEEGNAPGYKHNTSPYNDAALSQYLLTLTGTGMGREVNLTVAQLEALSVDDSGGANTLGDYTSANLGLRDEYSLTNTSYWSVNEYEGLKLYHLLGYFKMKADLEDATPVRFTAWDGYVSNESFNLGDLRNPELFGYYEKNAQDLGDGTYVPVAGDLKDSGYPVLIAYGVNRYPYVKTPSDAGFANGLNNAGGPLRVIFGKRDYFSNNGSNQIQKVQDVIVGEGTYKYSTHKYHENPVYTEMAASGTNDLTITVTDQSGVAIKNQVYSLGDVEDLIYGSSVSKANAALAKSKAYFELEKNGSRYSDLYEGVSLYYFIKNVLEVPGVKGSVTFSDGTATLEVPLEDVLASGSNPQSGASGLPATLAFAKNGAPMVATSSTAGYEKEFVLGDGASKFTVKNDGGPLAVLIPSTAGTTGLSDSRSMKSVTSIAISLETDNYAHTEAPYNTLASSLITVSGPGTYLAEAKDFTVGELEGKQTLAVTADYNIKTAEGESQVRYRGITLYDFLRSSAVGLRLNADKVTVTAVDGTSVVFSLAEIIKSDYINGQNPEAGNLKMILAFGSASVNNPDPEDGRPLVVANDSLGYDPTYLNAGGPMMLVVGQSDAGDQNGARFVKQVRSIEISASETVEQNHSINDTYKAYLNDTFTVRIQNADNTSSFTKVYTVGELEAMTSLIVNDEFTWVGINQHEGLDLWDLIKATAPAITDASELNSVTVYDGTFTKDVLSIFGKDALVNGIKDSKDPLVRKPIIMAYSQNGLPLVATTADAGYSESAGNTGGPLRLITHENQGACVRNADGVTVVLGGATPIDDPTEDLTLWVNGEKMTFAVSELKAMAATTSNYTKKTTAMTAKGVLLYTLLKSKGVLNPDALVSFSTPDNFQDSSKAVGYKDVTLKEIKDQAYLVAYSGGTGADLPEESLTEFNDLVKNTTIYTKLRVYRNFTTDPASWLNEMTNITGATAQDYALAIQCEGKTLRLTMEDLMAMKATTDSYTVKEVTKEVTGVLLADILSVMGIEKPQTKIQLITYDNFNHASYTNIPLSDIVAQDYLVAYKEGNSPISDPVKNDTVSTALRIYRHLTTSTSAWTNEAKSVVTIKATGNTYDFAQYPADGTTLPLAGIRSILSDYAGGYWAGTYGGGLVHVKSSGEKAVFNLSSTPALETTFVSAIAPDKAGGVWFSQNASYTNPGENKGLVYMDISGNLAKYTVEGNPGTIPDNYVQALWLDHGASVGTEDDVLWIGTFGGLTRLDVGTGTWTTYTKSGGNQPGFPATSVTTITPATDGTLWIGFYPEESGAIPDNTYIGGAVRFDPAAGQAIPAYTQVYTAQTDPLIGQARLADAWVRQIAVDSQGNAYIVRSGSTIGLLGTVGGHVDLVHSNGTKESYTGAQLLGGFLTGSSEIRTMTIDANGKLWFGTSSNGVAYCNPPVAGSPGNVLKTYSSKNQAWLMTNPVTGISTLDNIYVTSFIDGMLYVGSAGGICTLDSASAMSVPQAALSVYDHTTLVKSITLDALWSISAVEGGKSYNYAGYNTVPSWKTTSGAEGPTIQGILAYAGIDLDDYSDDTLISFIASDNYTVRLTKAQLLEDRYYYPNGHVGTASGAIGGSEALEGGTEVPAIINLLRNSGTLSIGQVLPNEQTWDAFNQYMADGGRIVIGDAALPWNPVTVCGTKTGETLTSVPSGSRVPAGTILEFERPNGSANKSAKIYYTTDGSTPGMGSTFYNYNEYAGASGITRSVLLNTLGEIVIKVVVIGRGGLSSEVTTFTYEVAMPSPGGLTAEAAGTSSIKLSWEEIPYATGYDVYRGSDPDDISQLIARGVTGGTYTDTGLATDSKYYYQIVATSDEGDSDPSETAGTYTKMPATTLKAASNGYNSVKLTWTPIAGAAGYDIFRSDASTGTFAYVGSATGSFYINTSSSLVAGKTYYYTICGYRMDGDVKVRGQESASVQAIPVPSAPLGLKASSAGYNSVKLTWSPVSGASGYYIYRYDAKAAKYVYVGKSTSTSYTNTSSALVSGTKYSYKVRAYRTVGLTNVAGSYSATVVATPLPAKPTISLAKSSSTSIRITWKRVPGASYYEIYRKTGSSGKWVRVGKTKYGTSTSWNNLNRSPGKPYYYKIRACRVVGSKVVAGPFSSTKYIKI